MMRNICQVEKCDDIVFAHGLCQMHDRRVRRHGNVDAGRPKNWGSATNHPLYDSWYWLKRSGGLDPSWHDFWSFVSDIGERPPNHSLRKINKELPYSKDNFQWKLKNLEIPITDRESKNLYMRMWNAKNQPSAKNYDLKKLYGITLDQFNKMLADQGGVCAICEQPETVKDPYSKKPKSLSVDHYENEDGTKRIRSLLCHSCNTSIGALGHDKKRFKRAIAYLNKHHSK